MKKNIHILLTLITINLSTSTASAHIPFESNWERVAKCESGNVWHLNTGNGFFGGLQFDRGTWSTYASMGKRSRLYPSAHLAPRWIQIRVAERLRKARGLRPWPVCGKLW